MDMNRQALLETFHAHLAEWREALASRSDASVITSTPWCVAIEDASLGLLIRGSTATPVYIRPGVGGSPLGITCMGHADAAKVASAVGNGYRPIPVKDVAGLRIQALEALIGWAS